MEIQLQQDIPWGSVYPEKKKTGTLSIKLPESQNLSLNRTDDLVDIIFTSGAEENSQRFVLEKNTQLFLEPALPEIPVVVRPKSALSLIPGASYSCVIPIPVQIQVLAGSKKKKDLLREYKLLQVTKSWFGDSETGETVYTIKSDFLKKPEDYDSPFPQIYCPVTIKNQSDQVLNMERMMLRVSYLNIYSSKTKLYSSKTHIAFRGSDQLSQINIQKSPPHVGEELDLYKAARKSEEPSIVSKTFWFIKSIYNG
jgi:hypothetical protein